MPDHKDILTDVRTIAVVGCSDSPYRTSHRIAGYLQSVGYRVIPINPHHDEVLGERCYPDLQHVPDDVTIDIVNIFRNPRYTADMVQQAVTYAEETGMKPVIWTQLGVSTQQAELMAREAGLPYIKNRCIMVEHARLVGA